MSTKSSLLTDLSVRTIVARAKRERRTIETRLGDGLELRAGVRKAAFSLKFVDRRTGRQERLALGYYPAIGLAEARRRAKEEQARIADPKVLANPARERRDISSMSTFKELAELRLADERLADTTRDYYRWCFELYAFPQIGGMAAGEVRTDDVVNIVDAVAKRAPATADRVQTAIASVFTWGMRERIITANPARGIPRRAPDLARDRVLRDCELRLVLEGLRSHRLNTSTDLSIILHLLLLTGARSSEVRLAEPTDLNWDGHANYKGPVWIVPGDRLHRGRRVRGRTKSGRPKVIPLSTQAAALFLQASDRAGARQRLFDVAERRAVSYAMARLCKYVGLTGNQSATPHDFRRTISTWLGDHGERTDVIETILGHSPHGVTRKHYNLSLLLTPVAQALQRWADHLNHVVVAQRPSTVREP
jgi:integrase